MAWLSDLDRHRQPAERINVWVTNTRSLVVRCKPGVRVEETVGHNRAILVGSAVDGVEGQASAVRADPECLLEALADARSARAQSPARTHQRTVDTMPAPPSVSPRELRRLAVALHDQVAAVDEAVATAGATDRRTERWSDHGTVERSAAIEFQLHVRSSRATLAGVQAAWLGSSSAGLDLSRLARDFGRAHHNLTASPVTVGAVHWLLLSPLVTARVLSRVVPSLRQAVATAPDGSGDPGRRLASAAVTVVRSSVSCPGLAGVHPDPDRDSGPDVAFLLRKGLLAAAAPSVATHGAAPGGMDQDSAGSMWYLVPTTTDEPVDATPPAGRGIVVERVFGFRGGLDMSASQLQFEVEGMAIDNGQETGTTAVMVTATPSQLLQSVEAVSGLTAPFRIRGLYGGSWCLLAGLSVRPR